MPVYPGATWRPVAGHTDGPMASHTGAVVHVNESTGNLFNWVAGDNNMSCHFEVYQDGSIEQYLDTAVSSWCQMAGNADYVSIETEGYHTDPFTPQQVTAIAGLMHWLHQVHGIPLTLAEQAGQAGLGWHGMGGAAWGGHIDCPGDDRRAQRAAILQLAGGLPAPTPEDQMQNVILMFAYKNTIYTAPLDLSHKTAWTTKADLDAYTGAVTKNGGTVAVASFSAGQAALIPGN